MLNSFKNNKGHGLLLESQNEGYFLAKIFNNFIENNYLSGVVVKGENNFAKIYQNLVAKLTSLYKLIIYVIFR